MLPAKLPNTVRPVHLMTPLLPHIRPRHASACTGDAVEAHAKAVHPLFGPARIPHVVAHIAQLVAKGSRRAASIVSLPSHNPMSKVGPMACSTVAKMTRKAPVPTLADGEAFPPCR